MGEASKLAVEASKQLLGDIWTRQRTYTEKRGKYKGATVTTTTKANVVSIAAGGLLVGGALFFGALAAMSMGIRAEVKEGKDAEVHMFLTGTASTIERRYVHNPFLNLWSWVDYTTPSTRKWTAQYGAHIERGEINQPPKTVASNLMKKVKPSDWTIKGEVRDTSGNPTKYIFHSDKAKSIGTQQKSPLSFGGDIYMPGSSGQR